MEPLADLLHTWRPANDKPNVLAVASPSDPFVARLLGLRQGEPPCEVVALEDPEVALRLLRRGRINVVVIEERPGQAGGVDLLLEALGKSPRPRILLISDRGSAQEAREPRTVRRVPGGIDAGNLRRLVGAAAAESENADQPGVSLAEVLDAIRYFPDECWLRVMHPDGSGDLCLRGGRAIYAEAGRKSGEPAAMEMVRWRACQFEVRDLPGYLPQNANLSIADMLGAGGVVSAAPASAPMPAAATVEVEAPQADDPGAMPEPGSDWAGLEPEDVPEFLASSSSDDLSPSAPEFDWDVEEPAEFPMDFTESSGTDLAGAGPTADLAALATAAAPTQPPAPPAAPAAPPPAADLAVFASVAVVSESGTIENCQPREDAVSYDPAALRQCFDAARDYALNFGFGPVTMMPLFTSRGGLVIAAVPGSARLIAARLPAPRFGEREQAAVQRLQRALEQAAVSG